MKVVIVGGVAGGATAAARIRRLKEDAEIIILEKTGYISYANCGLPYYIGDVIEESNNLILQTPQSFKNRFCIDVRVNNEVISVNSDKKYVVVKNVLTNETYQETYDKLILSPGAKPLMPNISGMDSNRIFTLKTVEDTFKMKKFIQDKNPKRVVIIGGGFIGMEMLENLLNLGLEVTLIEGSNQLLGQLDGDMASFVHVKLKNLGIRFFLNTVVSKFEDTGKGLNVFVDNQMILQTDIVLMTIGVVPETSFIKNTSITLGIKGSIVVNEKMETSIEDIYAVGDAVEVNNFVTNERGLILLAGPANKQARIAADNICGLNSRYQGFQSSSILKLFDWTVASTGISEKQAKKLNINYEKVILSPNSNASYYPYGDIMTIKVLYNKNNLHILGAQIIGTKGVDKRIDVFATAMRAQLKATELVNLDLSYAPPYSSAKDPVNMVGYIIENIEHGLVKQFHFEELEQIKKNHAVILLDTRTPFEYVRGHLEGFINIPIDELRQRLGELSPHKTIYVMCQSGMRSYLACRILSQNGFHCYNFSGGYRFYEINQLNQEILKSKVSCER
ncbi:MAG TPA: CoA-disulfide reductase [Acholeplasmatales bacterium]|nr:CoA-disulfide reductase [Acholeplasmatales bacterium]